MPKTVEGKEARGYNEGDKRGIESKALRSISKEKSMETSREEQVKRIAYYEGLMQRASDILRSGSRIGFARLQEQVKELSAYYGSDLWKQDFEDDEKGLLPSDLRRGVLSEDGIYDLLSEAREWTEGYTEDLFEKPYMVADILPKQVAKYQDGKYFEVEKYYRQQPRIGVIRKAYADLVIKLNCYFDLCVQLSASSEDGEKRSEWIGDPSPESIETLMTGIGESATVSIVVPSENSMLVLNGDDTYMTIYNGSEELLSIVKALAPSEGIFIWRPEE